ncbi:MAG TPA: metal-dependent hydrolase [Limnobacter sp.]|uniref:metal-dependent hydrolase n=1 Tax=Limnobacter sp. TaxID=2003368 RepID=UPI002E343DB7|nr:metal-dependent hydrolase [Limnobacter sp.]HEX5487395.1 metal-dependent hydrolase [Limnobacter sp.]
MKVLPVRRDVKINLNEARVNNWHEAGPHVTHFFNALSVLFPAGERLFMDSVRAYKDQVKDPELKKAITAFIGQEAYHSREHEEYNEMMARNGMPALKLDKQLWKLLAGLQAVLGKKMALAGTIALEHYTAIMANAVLTDPQVTGEHSDESFRQAWQWHAYEETEHKAVAYDVWNETVGDNVYNRFIRRFGMVLATVIFWPVMFYFHTRLVLADPNTRGKHLQGYKAIARLLVGEVGIFRKSAGEFMDYFRKSFHPWDHDNSTLLTQIDDFVAQVNQAMRNPNDEVKKAVRERLARKMAGKAAATA